MGAKGNYLFRGDKTVCGGRILEGFPDHQFFDKDMACEGHKVTCGKHPGYYRICGGLNNDDIHGKRIAGTLHSYSSCPCKSKFVPSNLVDDYELESQSTTTTDNYHKVEFPVLPGPIEPEPDQHAQVAKKKTGIDAGFAVLPYGGTTEAWQRLLFTENPPAGAKELFATLNGADERYKAGSIMLLVDPDKQDDEQIAHMKAAKARVDAALAPLTHEEANLLHKHYATIANFTSYADTGIGLAADPVGKYFESIEKILKEIQETYKNTYITRGALIGEQFYVRRSQLFKELESILKVYFLNKAMKFGEYTKIKNALGLSSSSITHKWNETGISDIEGYATHIERAAKYVKAMRYTGYLGIGFSGLHSLNEIHEACSVGREAECTKKKYTEIGSFALGTGGGVLAGGGAIPLCVAIGVGTAGVGGLVCTVIAGVGLGYAGSTVGSAVGELGGEQLYDVFGN
ncbi:PAAR domain-containing protein [Klebsiella michiganensis]|uniref:PAAR domain-containing protein n=1 Tax=Klebsiella michiganensis TaxID=1134687 RepID=UPI000667B3B5|nr:PAAR domain-containing protein [Klebsiella michiganensis]ELT9743208.1 PAAR domain-containing protein [Klebsiella michiganensis]MCY0830726.1 PAAR domain-containing protein [Klebsiella michiganensis]MDD7823671.1 PAAR domain-containing protein [Klebsiella michiganensis]MDD7852740.1 PAAR domain-containing protein [Klebsiella michiganensis]MEB6467438.1 PAAR domain-containing protein [Klebsiella michiganensis]